MEHLVTNRDGLDLKFHFALPEAKYNCEPGTKIKGEQEVDVRTADSGDG
jgi:hypothetical protein